mgnify:CR=1 FL=1
MKNNLNRELLADVAEKLIFHLQERNDVQNIDLMNLSGFCRNCISKWYTSSAKARNIDIEYEEVREIIYGMPYQDWKDKYQKEATKEQLEKRKNL